MATRYSLRFPSSLLLFVSIAQCLDDTRRLQEGNDLPYSLSESFKIQIRAAATPTVDLSLMPTCAQAHCLSDNVEIDCSPISVSCPTSAPSGATNCTTYPLSCYCAIPTPLSCAFYGCSWWNWQLVEDWFAGICPSVKPIDFTGLPTCARDCVADSSFDYGCITATRNCFCSYGSLFGCDLKCKQKDVDKMVSWFTAQCQAPAASATAALNNSVVETPKSDAPLPSIKKRPLHWYEIMAVVVAGMTLVALGVGLILSRVFGPKAKKD